MMEINKVSLKNFSSLRIGGEANLVVVKNTIELVEALMYVKKEGLRVHILGLGTNTFFGESLSNTLVIKIANRGISFEEKENYVTITAQAGEAWDDVVKLAVSKNLWGIENLSYVPGTVGAAPVQNIGAYGSELKDTFVSLSAVDTTTFDVVEITRDACNFGYRDSLFKQQKGRYVIVSVTMKLSKIASPRLSYKPLDTLVAKENLKPFDVRGLVVATRQAKLPDYNLYPNTGSFFKNPVADNAQAEGLRITYPDMPLIPHQGGYKIPAAWLIEHIAHMKGVRVGEIGTWPNQPLVLVNYGNATAEEFQAFTEEIIQKIKKVTGVTLEREVFCVF